MLRKLGLIAIAFGFALVLMAVVLAALSVLLEAGEREKSIQPETGVAGCIILFFIPVCFTTGSPNTVQALLVIAMISMLVILLITLLLFFLPLIRWIKLKNLGKAS